MSQDLVPGQNRVVEGGRVEVDASCLPPGFALAAIPLGQAPDRPFQGAAETEAPYLRPLGGGRHEIALDAFGAGTDRVELVAYATAGGRTLREIPSPALRVDGSTIGLPSEAGRFAAVIFARLYRHNGTWKLRALSEGSNIGLADLGRLIGKPLDPTPPPVPPGLPSGIPSQGGRPSVAWTGSGFLVSPGLLLTNAHVVTHASGLTATGFGGRSAAEPVVVDESCDIALLRVSDSLSRETLAFRTGRGPEAGEKAIALGYPLAGLLGSGLQVAEGSVSGLLGPNDDTRVLQITTPIQGGSSGGPVLDDRGRVIGVVTATLQGSQNVNFAVRGCLAQALVEAAGHNPSLAPADLPPLDAREITRMARNAVWRLEASQ
jgi:S1-C subfamily serine protease